MLGRLYDATWGRAFARGYDAFQRRSCAAGMEDKRRQVLGEARGRTLGQLERGETPKVPPLVRPMVAGTARRL